MFLTGTSSEPITVAVILKMLHDLLHIIGCIVAHLLIIMVVTYYAIELYESVNSVHEGVNM